MCAAQYEGRRRKKHKNKARPRPSQKTDRACRRGLRGNGSGGNEKCQRPFLIKVTARVPAQVPAPPENEQEN